MQASEQKPYRNRQERLFSHLRGWGIFSILLEDFEGKRNSSVRYLCGQPSDALLFLFASGKSVLVPWDENLAREFASVDQIVPYTHFNRSYKDAAAAIIRENGLQDIHGPSARRIEISGKTSFIAHGELSQSLPGVEILCRTEGIDTYISNMRMIKDTWELERIREACRITDAIMQAVAERLRRELSEKRNGVTEVDLALAIEREAWSLGAEGTGFETLAAGPKRSFAIHPFPAFTNQRIGETGFSIIDFGVRVEGYTSDVTITVMRDPLTESQNRMVKAVEDAYELGVTLVGRGESPQNVSREVDALFSSRGFSMPHALGHGIGLEAHEAPALRSTGEPPQTAFMPGMVFTLEPGLYDPDAGGVRLENDMAITDRGLEVLTHSFLLRLHA